MHPQLSASPKYRRWLSQLLANGLDIQEVEEVYTRFRHDGDPLFSLLLLHATTPEGDKIPPICFLKGPVVSVLVCLINKDTREKQVLLVRQRRICNGGLIYETVAGMVDAADDPHETAVRETEEETGLKVLPEQVIPLNRSSYFVSSGTSDEDMYFYYCEIEMSAEEIHSFHDRQQGVDHEHERIFTYICPIPEALRLITNVNSLLNIYLYLDQTNRQTEASLYR
ncbi:MAG: NUDIX hydrolase [Bacteroidetes bacterium]|jgi:ADP-sugar diphosphatase|nr:MAG: NUDIX hydrolase [Bacteroidota bacterium]